MDGRDVRAWARHEQAAAALQQVLALGRTVGVDVLPVKGVITARSLYADVTERRIQDVDVRVLPEGLLRLRTAARNAGVRELGYSRAFSNLVLEVQGMMVEFECHVGPPGLCGLEVRQMIARAERSSRYFGFEHLQPELHDHALLLCVNAFKDKLVEATEGAVRDLELLPRMRGFQPLRLAELARQAGVATLVRIVARWLTESRNVLEWAPVVEGLGPPPRPALEHMFFAVLRARAGGHSAADLPLRLLARDAADAPSRRLRTAGRTIRFLIERALLARGEGQV